MAPSLRTTAATPQASSSGRLASAVIDAVLRDIRLGRLTQGDQLPTESQIMARHRVSRTVVREALTQLRASGLVQTQHGVGTFVVQQAGKAAAKRAAATSPAPFVAPASPRRSASLREAVAQLELRVGLEVEAAGLAAQRRTPADLRALRTAIDAFALAVEQGSDAVEPDYQFHLALAQATHNALFSQWMMALGAEMIPRARLDRLDHWPAAERRAYLMRVHHEHESVLIAIEQHDIMAAQAAIRTHLINSRERRVAAARR